MRPLFFPCADTPCQWTVVGIRRDLINNGANEEDDQMGAYHKKGAEPAVLGCRVHEMLRKKGGR